MLSILVAAAVILMLLYYHLLHKKMLYWRKRGVPGPNHLPIVGNFGDIFMGKRGFNEIYTEIYRQYEGYPFVGVLKFNIPVLVVRDPDLIKCIMLENFGSFQKNDMFGDESVDPMYSRSPFTLEGAEWKAKRSEMTNCMAPAKIKYMYPIIEEHSRNMIYYIELKMKGSTSFDIGQIFRKLVINNIAACGLGVEGKSFEDELSEIKEMADEIVDTEGIAKIMDVIWYHYPSFLKLFRFRVFTQETENNLLSIIRSTLKYREDNNLVVNDYLQTAAKPNNAHTLSAYYDIAGHIASLMSDGYITIVNTMAFMIFELASDIDIQNKLRAEITECFHKNGGKFDYGDTMELKYLEACIHETLRKHPILPVLSKICTEEFTYTPSNPEYSNISVIIEPGTTVTIPAFAIHHDSKFFDNPEKFMPERFMVKNGLRKYTYLGFGLGPRQCMGSRFAMTQMKIGLAHFIKHFEFKVSPKTRVPLNYDPWRFMLSVRDGIWIELQNVLTE